MTSDDQATEKRSQQVSAHIPQVATPGLIAFGLLLASMWLLLYPYMSIFHDARLYTLQALAWLQPLTYGQDIFLRHGSQDNYTIFTPLYGWMISVLGTEPAAALLTLLGQLAMLCGCWYVVRRMENLPRAMLSMALVLALPSNYGSDYVFTYLEPFLTPRLFAEALVLLSIGSWLAEMYFVSILMLSLAALLHPIMAAAGIAFIGSFWFQQRYGWRTFAVFAVAALALIAATGILAHAVPRLIARQLVFDSAWLDVVRSRSPYLFLAEWAYADWARNLIPLASLLLVVLFTQSALHRSIASTAIAIAISGLALTAIGVDICRIIIITQSQPWRWVWLSTLLAVVLLPHLVQDLWRQGAAGQSAVLLLTAAWLMRNEAASLGLLVLALGASLETKCGKCQPGHLRLIRAGSIAVLVLTTLYMVAVSRLTAGWLLGTAYTPEWLARLRGWFQDGLIPLLVAGISYVLLYSRRTVVHQAQLLASAVLLLTVGLFAWDEWAGKRYPQADVEAFAGWRDLIPLGQEVLWIGGPEPTWLLLNRPSYISSIQTTVTLFSRDAAMSLKSRAASLTSVFPNAQPLMWREKPFVGAPSTKSLAEICESISADFVVTKAQLDSAPVAAFSSTMSPRYQGLQLFRCDNPS